jgi:hypothetical protein
LKAITDLLHLRFNTEAVLLLSIVVFVLAALLFLTLILISRYQKIYMARAEAAMLPVIEELLFPVVFSNTPYAVIKEHELWKKHMGNKTFMRMLVSGIFKMHKTYSGGYAQNLRQFFIEAGLARLSIQQLQSTSWSKKCEAIRILSQLHIAEAYEPILTLTYANEDILRLEALAAIVQMKGFRGIEMLVQYTKPINDWIQINLLYYLKFSDNSIVPDFGYLLFSANKDVVKLGCRLIEMYKQKANIDTLQHLMERGHVPDVAHRIKETILKLESF